MVDHPGPDLGTPLGQEAAIRAALDAVEATGPGRVRAAYIEGSRADGSAVPTSDLDLAVVFAGAFRDGAARRAAEDCLRRVRTGPGVDLDVTVMDEVELAGSAPPMLKLAGRLVYGADVVAAAPLMPIAAWTRDRMHVAYWLVTKVFGRPPAVRLPIGYPDPGDEFFGYARRAVALGDGTIVPSTRDLVRVTGWMATALVALGAGRYVPRKRDCHLMYRRWVGDAWSSLLDDIDGWCRGEWTYLVPEEAEARERLRAICARTLAFENAFLGRYRAFLLADLRGAGAPTFATPSGSKPRSRTGTRRSWPRWRHTPRRTTLRSVPRSRTRWAGCGAPTADQARPSSSLCSVSLCSAPDGLRRRRSRRRSV